MSKGIIMIETEIPKNCYCCHIPDESGWCEYVGIFIGKIIFFTREEAEAKLAEKGGGENG